jgi:hypothetical protein
MMVVHWKLSHRNGMRGPINAESRKEVNRMSNTNSNKGKYVFAALVGAAAGGVLVAVSTRAVPKMMSEMEGKCKQMMAGLGETGCGAGDMCQQMSAEKGQAPQQATCHSEGASCHGSD